MVGSQARVLGLVLGCGGLVLSAQDSCEPPPGSGSFTSAEPVGPSQIMLLGDGDTSLVSVYLNDVLVPVGSSYVPEDAPARAYLNLTRQLQVGRLDVALPGLTVTRSIAAQAVSIGPSPTHTISEHIYGVGFAPDGDWVAAYGPTVARWGGNASTLYNPGSDVTNAGADWFFENRASTSTDPWIGGSADLWIERMRGFGLATLLSVPALDWVAADDYGYAYSITKYGPQEEADAWRPDAGNGVTDAGEPITWNDPWDFAVPWSAAAARSWLEDLPVAPEYAAVDNELDICSETHRSVHPDPMGYDELLSRYLDTAYAIRGALPDTRIVGPASCCWWFYWNSMVGASDKAAHGGMDLLPWFLTQLAAEQAATGQRLLDVLDVHYYPDGVQGDAADAETAARRLRSTRSLWDPTYVDEGWIGEDLWASQTQPSRNTVMLIPRLKALIGQHYPGTALGVTEWNWGAEWDTSGGLAVADVLGIFGRQGLDLATYWNAPPSGSPAAAAFALYNKGPVPFGRFSLPVTGGDPDTLGVYAALDNTGRATLVVVNKAADADLLLNLSGWGGGAAGVRHFGGAAYSSLIDSPVQTFTGQLLVPAHAAALISMPASAGPQRLQTPGADQPDDGDGPRLPGQPER